jgi:hypothetical protein
MTHRKSAAAATTNGNTAKYLSYREAWARINQAHAQGYFLEVVTIAESIIGDRLVSYLARTGAELTAVPKGPPSFGSLIQRWKKLHPEPIVDGDIGDLQAAVDRWRARRNLVIHGIVRAQGGQHIGIDEFRELAEITAIEGKVVARAVCRWHERATREAKTQPSAIQCESPFPSSAR